MRILKRCMYGSIFLMNLIILTPLARNSAHASVFEHVAPAVVNVHAIHLVKRHDIFDFFFPFGGMLGAPHAGHAEKMVISLSGVCVDESGLVVTNAWAVLQAKKIICLTQDGKEVEAEVVYHNGKNGLALLKLNAPQGVKFPKLEISKEKPQKDIKTFAAALTRKGNMIQEIPLSAATDDVTTPFVTVSKPFDVAYSGGALVQNGKLIGILDSVPTEESRKRGVELGFAIPASEIEMLLKDYRDGKATKPEAPKPMADPSKVTLLGGKHMLSGYGVADLTPELAKQFKLDEKVKGVVITHVPPTSDSGFFGPVGQIGDVIRMVNGSKIGTVAQLVELLKPADQTVFQIEVAGKNGVSSMEFATSRPKSRHHSRSRITDDGLEGTI